MRTVKSKRASKSGYYADGGKVKKYGKGGSVKKKCKLSYKKGIR